MNQITPPQFQEYTVAYYNGQSPYDTQGHLTNDGSVLLRDFNAMLASVPDDLKATDAQKNALYLQFLLGKMATVRMAEETNALSPEEKIQRNLVYNVYSVLASLLDCITTSQIANTAVLNFLSQKQGQYANLIQKTVSYIGSGTIETGVPQPYDPFNKTPSSTADAAMTQISYSTDPTKFTLGYGNVSVNDISQYLADQLINNPAKTSVTFDLASTPWQRVDDMSDPYDMQRNLLTLSAVRNLDNSITVAAIFRVQRSQSIFSSYDWVSVSPQSPENFYFNDYQVTTVSTTSVTNALNTMFLSTYDYLKAAGFIEISNSTTGVNGLSTWERNTLSPETQKYAMAARNLSIPWEKGILASSLTPYTTDPTWVATLNKLSQTRTQYNQVINAYVSGEQAQQQLIGDKTSQQHQIVQGATSSREMTNKILKGFIQQLSSILQSIFKA